MIFLAKSRNDRRRRSGRQIHVTVIHRGQYCRRKSEERDGYNALVRALVTAAQAIISAPVLGFHKKQGLVNEDGDNPAVKAPTRVPREKDTGQRQCWRCSQGY